MPFNTDGSLKDEHHIARAIRQHTIVTHDVNTAIVIASLPPPRDKRFLDERGSLFEKFTTETIKNLEEADL